MEYDDDKDAIVNPFKWNLPPFSTNKLIITFFPDVMKELMDNNQLELEQHFAGENPVDIYRFKDQPDVLPWPSTGVLITEPSFTVETMFRRMNGIQDPGTNARESATNL